MKIIMKWLARRDFKRGYGARRTNEHYLAEYGRLYEQAEKENCRLFMWGLK